MVAPEIKILAVTCLQKGLMQVVASIFGQAGLL